MCSSKSGIVNGVTPMISSDPGSIYYLDIALLYFNGDCDYRSNERSNLNSAILWEVAVYARPPVSLIFYEYGFITAKAGIRGVGGPGTNILFSYVSSISSSAVYVWGSKTHRVTLNKANGNTLNKKGKIELCHLSHTVSDAATVVERLDERYLWVDAFIIQDDPDDLTAQLPAMGHIFARSLLTIVAATSEDAETGLPGVNAQARSVQRVLGPLGGGFCTEYLVQNSTDVFSGVMALEVPSGPTLDFLVGHGWHGRGPSIWQDRVLKTKLEKFSVTAYGQTVQARDD
ncbi:hypothetical protein MMC28_009761 [Mycoblastus sanguinarius]|nr:hypothetical protein [Mycoblastus sanguinarius]